MSAYQYVSLYHIAMDSHSRIEDLVGVLLVTRDGATKTRIMYERCLTSSQAEGYLSFLQLSDLIRREEATQLFRPTRKGTSLLMDYEHINQEIDWCVTA
jgi:predicted transcriptional regulator